NYKIKLNSLGCAKDKKELTSRLHQALEDKLYKLCADCKTRFKKNTLRILDCKKESCQGVVRKLDIQDFHLCPECKAHFARVRAGLDSLKINYEVSSYLVRGLDYYTRTVFELTHQGLGAQDALGAGGRYDNLVKELGGPELGAMGFAFGVERLLLVTRSPGHQVTSQKLVYVIALGDEAKIQGLKLLDKLRKERIICDTDYEGKSLKSAMRKANDLGAGFVLLIGENELKKNVVTLKDMTSGEQREIEQDNLVRELKNKTCI
ncbi:MAG: His/Gly/Thr/Pro-type tRNA ligase C-terminal domain-containing protein, partial [Candidatus Omnitrophota bacterium]